MSVSGRSSSGRASAAGVGTPGLVSSGMASAMELTICFTRLNYVRRIRQVGAHSVTVGCAPHGRGAPLGAHSVTVGCTQAVAIRGATLTKEHSGAESSD